MGYAMRERRPAPLAHCLGSRTPSGKADLNRTVDEGLREKIHVFTGAASRHGPCIQEMRDKLFRASPPQVLPSRFAVAS